MMTHSNTLNADRLARYLCESSPDAFYGGEAYEVEPARVALGFDHDQMQEAIDDAQMRGWITHKRLMGGRGPMRPEWELYFAFDPSVKGWDPSEDAFTVARALVDHGAAGAKPSELAQSFKWPARRINVACGWLSAHGMLEEPRSYEIPSQAPFYFAWLRAGDATRQFVGSSTSVG